MDYKRIIPCLDIQNGATVKGVNFVELKEVGNPVALAKKYAKEGADELALLDISATQEGKTTFTKLVTSVANNITIPLIVGGGIASVDDAKRVLNAGASKVSISSAAVARPELIEEIAERFGKESVIVAIDAKIIDGDWIVTTHGGNNVSEWNLFDWAQEAERLGAGELLFTSMEHDGTRNGYPCRVYAQLHNLVDIPIIASGGAGTIDHIADVLTKGKADAALAASIFHYDEIPVSKLKLALSRRGIEIHL